MDPINLTPLDIQFLRSVDHVIADLGREERILRTENWALLDKLATADAEIARLDRVCRMLWACVVALLCAGAWLGWVMGAGWVR